MEEHHQRRKRNSSKVNLTISAVFHCTLILGVAYFAAREGMLGKTLKQITVTMAPKPEPPKAKPPEPKIEPPKPVEPPKVAAVVPPRVEQAPVAPPPAEAPAAVAPAAAVLPDMVFNDGAHAVVEGNPNTIYKGLVEHALRTHWNRPEDIADETYVAEVEVTIDSQGNLTGYQWRKGSGDTRWDKSVKAALAATPSVSRPPPKGFPSTFLTRFDVESLRTEEVAQINPR
jgi:hypothetical protein